MDVCAAHTHQRITQKHGNIPRIKMDVRSTHSVTDCAVSAFYEQIQEQNE